MHHDIRATYENGSTEIIHSNLKLVGDDNMSSMCKSVGYTAAIGVDLILKGKITQKGVVLPFQREIYDLVLGLLEEEGIRFEETLLLGSSYESLIARDTKFE